MKLSRKIKNLLITLLSNQSIVASWGISNIQIEKNSINFVVHGMKYHGTVSVLRSTRTTYSVRIGDKVFKYLKLDDVINRIDEYIEHTDNYQEDIMKWLSLKNNECIPSSKD